MSGSAVNVLVLGNGVTERRFWERLQRTCVWFNTGGSLVAAVFTRLFQG